MYTNNRDAYRQAFFSVWQKHLKSVPLEPVETQLIHIILLHPEYHALLEKPDTYQHQEFALEENPFVHMSLHLAVREQVQTDRPAGIALIKQELLTKHPDLHYVEHLIMGCLSQMIWAAQQTGAMPGDEAYLKKLREM